jgi:hypothetical protein
MRVLSARPASAETSLSFAGLADLLDGVEPGRLGSLPAPQCRALEVALLRADPGVDPAMPRAIALGLLSLLRQLAADRPLLVAVDDLQWLDRPTADALAFAVRRLQGPGARTLLAARPGSDSVAGPVRGLLLALALGGDLDLAQLGAIAAPGVASEALAAGVVVVDGDRARAAHPLLAAAVRSNSDPAGRQAVHLELAGVTGERERRARHLALGTPHPDERLARTVAAAAAARGAAREAAELGEHALRLTPGESGERTERVLRLADYLERVGERQRVTDLLMPELESLPEGGPRVRAWLLLSEGGVVSSRSYYGKAPYFDKALSECGSDAWLRAEVLARKALSTAAEGVERIGEAEAWALQALHDAAGAGPELERLALRPLGWSRCLRGRPIDDLCERFRAVSSATSGVIDSPEPLAGLRSVWRGEMERARVILGTFLSVADERGEGVGYAWLRLNVCELELRTAQWAAASRLLDEWGESEDLQSLITPTTSGAGRSWPRGKATRRPAATAGRSWRPPGLWGWPRCSRTSRDTPPSGCVLCGSTPSIRGWRIRAPSPWRRNWSRPWWRSAPGLKRRR